MRVSFVLAVQAFAIARALDSNALTEGPWHNSYGSILITSSGDNLPDDYRLTTNDNSNIQHSYACGGGTPTCKAVSRGTVFYDKSQWYETTVNTSIWYNQYHYWAQKNGYETRSYITAADAVRKYAWCCPDGTKMVKDSNGDVVLFSDAALRRTQGDMRPTPTPTPTPTKEYGVPLCMGKKVDCMTQHEIKLTSHDKKCKCLKSEYCFTCGPNNGFSSCTQCENYIAKYSTGKDCGLRTYNSYGAKDCRQFKKSQAFCPGTSFSSSSMDVAFEKQSGRTFTSLLGDKTVKLTKESTAFQDAMNNYEGSQYVFSCPNAGATASITEKIVFECKKSQKFVLTQNTCKVYCDGRVSSNNDLYETLFTSLPSAIGRTSIFFKPMRGQSTAAPELGQPVGSQLVYGCPRGTGILVLQCSKNGRFEVLSNSCKSTTTPQIIVVDGRRKLRANK